MKENKRNFSRILREMNAAESHEVVLTESYWTAVESR